MNDTRRRKLRAVRALLREAAGILAAEAAVEADEVSRFRLVQARQGIETAIAAINIAHGPDDMQPVPHGRITG